MHYITEKSWIKPRFSGFLLIEAHFPSNTRRLAIMDRDKLIMDHLEFARQTADNLTHRRQVADKEDARSAAHIALVELADMVIAGRVEENDFRPLLYNRIRWEIQKIKGLRGRMQPPGRPEIFLEEVLDTPAEPSTFKVDDLEAATDSFNSVISHQDILDNLNANLPADMADIARRRLETNLTVRGLALEMQVSFREARELVQKIDKKIREVAEDLFHSRMPGFVGVE
jgi:hypothetical protein